MSVLEILRWPDERLTQVCAPVGAVTRATRRLAADMLETMYAAPGRGLAGPQVGAMLRIFVMDAQWKQGEPTPVVMIDPELEVLTDEVSTQAEGCLSIPGVAAEVTRPTHVRMTWTDLEGARLTEDFSGFEALCVQHELDHLNGTVTLDHLDDETRARVLRDYSVALT
jgi:peptide deformylase